MESDQREVAEEILPFIRVYKDGSFERLIVASPVPPSLDDPATGASSKDILISEDTGVSARLYLPRLTRFHQKLPILVYFHGGGFCIGSAFAAEDHRYLNSLSSQSGALIVTIDYRLAPEHLLPTAYEDCWSALQWVAAHSAGGGSDPWLTQHGDFGSLFMGGDSAGGNIAHNMAMQAGREGLPNGVAILGVILVHTYFWGSEPVGSESRSDRDKLMTHRIWKFLYPDSEEGIDDPMVNPFVAGAPSLAGLGCKRMLVCVAEKDMTRDRSVRYCEAVKDSGWDGEVELYEALGEDHLFHILSFDTEAAQKMIKHLACFIQN